TILITGATDGIGEGLARRLVEHGREVIVHGRSREKADAAAERVGANAIAVADLTSFAQVRAMADDVAARFERLDALVNNAGIGFGATKPPRLARTEDGRDPTWQVNVLSAFLLTQRLQPRLTSGRVTYVSSGLHSGGRIDFDHPDDPRRGNAYGQSKLAQVMLAREQADRWPDVDVNACSPGWIATKMGGSGGAPLEQGVDTPFWLVTDPDLRGTSGRYFSSRREQRPHPSVEDADARSRLWDLVERSVA
ncbi:MAG: hypothetical protein QOF76_5365, partial [Solirubrobacteraceae bacterium]|nr:hypothetical protein [Solirubrobacteraceae bacterium]